MVKYKGKFSVLEGTGIFVPDLKCRLLIPRDHFMDIQRLYNKEFSFTVTWYKSILKISEQVPIIIHYDHTTRLLMLHAYKSIYITVCYLDMTGYVTSSKNQNLTHLEKLILKWNFKLSPQYSELEGKVGW